MRKYALQSYKTWEQTYKILEFNSNKKESTFKLSSLSVEAQEYLWSLEQSNKSLE